MRTFILLIALAISTSSFADAWDNMTEEEAIATVNYLRMNPYIFDYCDCCRSHDDADDLFVVRLIRVTNMRVIPCTWDEGKFSVEYDFAPVATLTYTEDGRLKRASRTITRLSEEEQHLLYMNYTWAFNEESKLAEPLFKSIDYSYVVQHGGQSCNPPFSYPKPEHLESVGKFKGYKQWYKQAMSE
jgi:hypothetical protein